MIFNPQNLGVTWWMASGESVDLGNGYLYLTVSTPLS